MTLRKETQLRVVTPYTTKSLIADLPIEAAKSHQSSYKINSSHVSYHLLNTACFYVVYITPYPAKLNNLNFQQFEDVSCYRDPQLQVAENY